MIPRTFEEWKNCMIKDCKINLTCDFAEKRMNIYKNSNHPETQKFAKLYGEQHLNNVIYWFSKIG